MQSYPQLAASTIAMQKDSVSDVLRKMSPLIRTYMKDKHKLIADE